MNKAEKIKAEIEKRKQELRPTNTHKMQVGEMDRDVLMWLNALTWVKNLIDTLEEEPISNDLEEACDEYYDETWDEHGGKAMVVDGCHDIWFPSQATEDFFIAGAQWQKEHLEMNRIKHCNNITEEQYNLETEFLDGWIEKYDRLPTFLDAIEHGMKLQKEQDQSTIELAEDHAMLAGMEKMKEEMIDNFFKWLAKHWREYVWLTDNNVIHFGHLEYDFRRAMEE